MAIQKYRGPTTPIESDPQSSRLPRRRGGLKSRPQQPRPKVGINYRTYQPENWEQVQRPVIRKWSPSYDVSYWENPVNIARNYWAIKSAAPGQEVPEWMDAEGVEAAYKYMTHIQGSDDWTNWKHINPDDPVRQYLQGMQAPPMEWQLKPEDYQKWLTSDLSQRDPDTWTDEEIYKLSPELQSSYNEYRQMWNEKVPFEDLPTWQQMQYHIQSNPVMGGAATMVPFALAGGAGGLAAGGPIGGLIGAGAPLAMGAGLGYLSQKYPTAAELLQVLDWPAEQAERAIGLGLQIQGSLVDPETYGSLQEITQNLPTAYEAGTTAYTAGAPFNVNQEDAQAWYDLLGIEGEARAGRLDPTNIFPAAEYALRYISGKDTSGIQFADPSQVHPQLNVITDDEGTQYAVGGVTPVDLDAVGMSALVEARRRMVAGEDPDAVIQEYVDKFGFSGEFTELAGHIALDPLNFVPKVSSRGVGFVADLQGNKPLARAFYSADGPVHGWKQYKNFVNQGLAGASDELSAFQLFVGGLTDNGVIKSLDPEYTSTNPVKRWLGHLSNLTPEAKTRTLLAMGSDNINNVLDFRRGDPLGMGELVRGLINEDPAKMARTAQYLGSPEWATLRQAASSFEPKLADLENIWKGTEQHRSILNDIKQITGLDEPTILKLASESETAQALHTKLMSDAAAAGDEALQSLEVGDLRQIVDAYTGDNPAPWHPDEYAARLSVSWGEHLAEWGIEQYGVTKPSNVTKFWNTMKRAQSVVLLGFNPAYAVNNVVNNSVTRAATGIWGYASPGTISKFWQDWGYVPYRAEAGTGVAQAVPDIQVGAPGEAGSISQTLGTYRPGEEIIRQAATPETKGPARRVIDAADKLGIFTKVSGAAERVESAQSMYAGTTKFWRNNWKRRRGFELWSSELKQGFNEAFPEIRNIDDAVYSILEGSPSRTIAEQRLNDLFTGNGPIHDIDLAMNDIAKGMGVDAATVRENLSLVDDSLRANLEGAQTVSDYQTAYAKTRADARDAIAQQLADDLNTRFDQVTTQGGGGGFAEAQRIYSDAQFSGSEFWVNDLMAWQDTIDKAWEMRASGTDADVINTLYRERRAETNADWSNHRKFEKSTWLGFLESMGVKDADSRAFLKGTDDAAKLWDDYFGVVEQRRSEFFKIDHGDDFKRAWM